RGPRVEAHPNQAYVNRKNCSVNRVDVLELLADQAQREVVQTVAAVALWKADPGEADRSQLRENLGIMVNLAIVGAYRRRELPRAEVTNRRHELPLVGGQRQVEHTYGFIAGVGVCFGVAVGLPVGLGVGEGAGVGTGCRSFGPTWPMKGR